MSFDPRFLAAFVFLYIAAIEDWRTGWVDDVIGIVSVVMALALSGFVLPVVFVIPILALGIALDKRSVVGFADSLALASIAAWLPFNILGLPVFAWALFFGSVAALGLALKQKVDKPRLKFTIMKIRFLPCLLAGLTLTAALSLLLG